MSAGVARAEWGIVVWKEQPFHDDASARAFVFDRMKPAGGITWFFKGSERMGFEKHRDFDHVLVPPALPPELAEPGQFASFRHQVAELETFAKRYAAAARILEPQLEVMRGVIADYEAGQVYFSGEWMPRADYEARVAARDRTLHENAARRQAELAEESRRLHAMERAEGRRLAYAYGSGVVLYLILLITSIVRRMRRTLVLLLLAPLLAAGWMTYRQGGYGWFKQHAEKVSRSLKGI